MLLQRQAQLALALCARPPVLARCVSRAGPGARLRPSHLGSRPGAQWAALHSPRRGLRRSAAVAAAEAEDVTVQQAKELVDSGAATYLDCRTVEEFQAGHPPGAVNVAVLEKGSFGMMQENPHFVDGVEQAIPDKTTQIVVGCQAGVRSLKAQALLVSRGGYSSVKNVLGGYKDWTGSGLPTET